MTYSPDRMRQAVYVQATGSKYSAHAVQDIPRSACRRNVLPDELPPNQGVAARAGWPPTRATAASLLSATTPAPDMNRRAELSNTPLKNMELDLQVAIWPNDLWRVGEASQTGVASALATDASRI